MKKWGILALVIAISIVIGLIVGLIIGNGGVLNSNPKSEKILARQGEENELKNSITANILTVSANSNEETTTPSTKIKREVTYKKCGHVVSQTIDIPEEFINLNLEEFKSKYNSQWKIDSFNSKEIVMSKSVDTICDEHYVLKENNGYVAIYSIDEFGVEKLKETTAIVINYLPQEDIDRIKAGIYVEGKQSLNSIIEDFE